MLLQQHVQSRNKINTMENVRPGGPLHRFARFLDGMQNEIERLQASTSRMHDDLLDQDAEVEEMEDECRRDTRLAELRAEVDEMRVRI